MVKHQNRGAGGHAVPQVKARNRHISVVIGSHRYERMRLWGPEDGGADDCGVGREEAAKIRLIGADGNVSDEECNVLLLLMVVKGGRGGPHRRC